MATQTLEQRETTTLIGSDKVEGTNVYRSNGDKIGSIERIMLDKLSGKVAYAVMSFGGFLGIGHEHYPVPWSLLTYNTGLGGYEVNISDSSSRARRATATTTTGTGRTASAPSRSTTTTAWRRTGCRRTSARLQSAPFGFPSGADFCVRRRAATPETGCANYLSENCEPDPRRPAVRPRHTGGLSRRGDHRRDHPLARRRRQRGPDLPRTLRDRLVRLCARRRPQHHQRHAQHGGRRPPEVRHHRGRPAGLVRLAECLSGAA